MASLARDNGWAGVVVNGCVRDVAVLAQLDVGIAALGSTPRPSGKMGEGEIDVPVTFGGVSFRPGDSLYADDDGIVVLASAA
jgi:regulator of ribonuclease activity A